jgi:alpha-1,2-mannosyltransferase
MTIFYAFETQELPRLLNESGLLPPIPRDASKDDLPRIDLSPIKNMDLQLCLAKEWHRFPGHYLVPDGVRVDFVKSDFDGVLPGHFQVSSLENSEGWWLARAMSQQPEGLNDLNREEPSHYVRSSTRIPMLAY